MPRRLKLQLLLTVILNILLLFLFCLLKMADTKDCRVSSSVQKDPNFAVICSFLTKYGTLLGLTDVSFDQLEKWIEDSRYGECCYLTIHDGIERRQ